MASSNSFGAFRARQAVRAKVAAEVSALMQQAPDIVGQLPSGLLASMESIPAITPDNLPADPKRRVNTSASVSMQASLPDKSKVCIVGAGVTGLYIAMILDSLNIPGLTYEILEGSSRTGGRLYSYYFTNDKHDYYDIGAMRFPDIKIMKRTFDLFNQLNIPLIPYYLDPASEKPPAIGSLKTPTMYNDICVVDQSPAPQSSDPDPFRISVSNGGSVPDSSVKSGVSGLLDTAFGPYKELMLKSFEEGFEKLMTVDDFSTREYLKDPSKMKQNLDFFTVQWLETNNTSTNLFDEAFSESVIDSFDFASPENGTVEKWYCIDGGTSLLTKGMEAVIKGKVEHWKRVRKITKAPDDNLIVSVANEPQPRDPYVTVFNTTSLGCLQRMDLTGLALHPSQKDAIRSLHYDDSAKVAIKFRYPWWIKDCGITTGGVGSTDMPLRTCVYPSYNLSDGLDKEAVLLCSYTWAQDAIRVGSLIKPHSPEGEEELRDLMLDNLARLHLKNFNDYSGATRTLDEVRRLIADAYVTHHAFSWSHDSFTSGAFALFGPGQFTNLYPYLARPAADSRFHILGEASSAHHAWIVGSLESAYAGVWRFLEKFCRHDYQQKMRELWGTIPEFEGECDAKGSQWLQVALGMLKDGEFVVVPPTGDVVP